MDEEGKKDVKAQLEYPDEELGIDRVQPTIASANDAKRLDGRPAPT